MAHQFSRIELMFGREGYQLFRKSSVAVLGLGGVGSFTAEALARTGIGRLILLDKDCIDITNINRQIHSTLETVGQPKVEVMKKRIATINPDCEVIALQMFYQEETAQEIFRYPLDYVADAMDTISAKLHLIMECKKRNIPIISSMGAANKIDPTRLKVADLFETTYDPIAKVLRRELRKRGITKGVPVVYSTESPIKTHDEVLPDVVSDPDSSIRKVTNPPASNGFVPSVAGLIMASVIIRELLERNGIEIQRKG